MIRFLKNKLHFIYAFLACVFFRFPGRNMMVIGITGTDGKTTTTHLIFELLKYAGKKVSMLSTIQAMINNETIDTGFHVTTPDSWVLQKLMRQAFDGGSQYFVLETTSHALDQYRVYGTSIDIGVITNISHEHIDYHGTIINYRNTKAKILSGVKYAILNKDDSNFQYLSSKVLPKNITSFGIDNPADVKPKTLNISPKILGKFNLYNCLAAVAVGKRLNIKDEYIQHSINNFEGIAGRLEKVRTNKDFSIFIDFAHKPNALQSVLETLRRKTKRKLIVVFGCAGLRDRLKRPMMGEIAAKVADYVILTAEDPRTEDVREINKQIAEGCIKGGMLERSKGRKEMKLNPTKKYFWRIADRQEAINFSIRKLAKNGDIVLITGKGHEKSMCYGNIEYPWNEREAIEKALYDKVR